MPIGKIFQFGKMIKEFRNKRKRFPTILGNIAKNHVLEAFDKEGFTDSGFSPWEKRKRLTKADRKSGRNRRLLVESGALRASIGVRKATLRKIAVGSYNIKYATFHNRGIGSQKKRQFVGPSRAMNEKILRRIVLETKKIF